MYCVFAAFVFAALVAANPAPGGVTGAITPSSGMPNGCSANYAGTFNINPVNVTSSSKRSLHERDSNDILECTLHNGVLTDNKQRTGYIASNSQFQFDNPPQAGAIYTAGFSVCPNGTLALGGDTTWYSCLSGKFYNLYEENTSEQCHQVYLMAVGSGSPATSGTYGTAPTSAPASTYGTPGTTVAQTSGSPSHTVPTECKETIDGQPQCSTVTVAPVPTSVACGEHADGQAQCSDGASAAGPAPSSSYTGAPIVPGAADTFGVGREMVGLAAGVLAFAML